MRTLVAVGWILTAANSVSAATDYEARQVAGWTVQVSRKLIDTQGPETNKAIDLLKTQLEDIVRVVPAPAVAQLRQVPLWVSPEYPQTKPKAEYHPSPEWLRDHGRNPVMAKAVEFTNVRIFEAEVRRMPNFALHELAHAYHHQFVERGFGNAPIKAAYESAQASGKYNRVERRDAEGRRTLDRAYALVNPQEYFAETTEAFFAKNDFFPYNREELKQHDPEMFALLAKLWGANVAATPPGSSIPKATRTEHLP